MTNSFDNPIKRVAAYCRVSTDNLDQANSLESQQRYFNEYIRRNPLWELHEIYVDEGVSGTGTKKRAAFNRMIEDAKEHKFDLILTKEISRFARNVLDSIGYTRQLKAMGIGVIFMNDNINTLDADSELRLTIMSSIAQEESRRTSERVKWGHRRRMEQGVVFGRDMLGYDVRSGELHINEEGAEIVRLIFHKYLDEGKGTHVIAHELREAGIRTSTYMKEWSYTVILRILKNEKYCGDLVQQKTFTPDYLTHGKKYNRGEMEFVTIRDHHEPIISREVFEATQREIERRHELHASKNGFANRYAMSGKIICGECGSTFVHIQRTAGNGSPYEVWRCIRRQREGGKKHTIGNGDEVGCNCCNLHDRDIRDILQYVVGQVMRDRESLLQSVLGTVSDVLKSCSEKGNADYFESELQKIEGKKQKLLDMCLSGDIETVEYKKGIQRLNEEQLTLQEKLAKEKARAQLLADKTKLMEDISGYIHSLSAGEEWDDTFYRSIVDKIVVHADRTLDVHLKCIPDRWQARILQGRAEIEKYNREKEENNGENDGNGENDEKMANQGDSEPMSVRIPFNSAYGMA